MRDYLSMTLQTTGLPAPAGEPVNSQQSQPNQPHQQSPALPFKALLEMYLPQDNTDASAPALPRLQTAQMKIYQQARLDLSAQITHEMTARQDGDHGDGK
ncbi:hypothetical protein ACO0LF_17020 [Undibacterium sp. Di27W]|uniref:hypothetical protein n=1 Tax=Undibacterium sp. Di27W TaxID=3413036 RepID=UPI003BF3BC1A